MYSVNLLKGSRVKPCNQCLDLYLEAMHNQEYASTFMTLLYSFVVVGTLALAFVLVTRMWPVKQSCTPFWSLIDFRLSWNRSQRSRCPILEPSSAEVGANWFNVGQSWGLPDQSWPLVGWIGLEWGGMGRIRLDWVGLVWIGLGWITLAPTGWGMERSGNGEKWKYLLSC